jgi:porin
VKSSALLIGCALGVLFLGSRIRAQSTLPSSPEPVAPPPSSSGAVPDAAIVGPPEVPVDIRPFQLTLPKDHLLRDWFGVRTELERMGITPTLTLETDVAANPTGGRSQGITEASNLDLNLLFDLDKIGGIKDATFLLQLSERWGNSLSSDKIGNDFTTQQVYGGETLRVVDAAYKQKFFDDRFDFRIGRIGAGDDFLVSPYNYLFMQNAFDGNPVGIFFDSPGMSAYPNAAWGAVAKVRPTDRTYAMLGVYDGDPNIRGNRFHGVDMSLDGPVFVIGECGLHVNGLPGGTELLGNFKAGFWYDNSAAIEFGSTHSQRGSWGVYGLFDQVLVPFADRKSNRGLGVFGSTIFSTDPSVAQLPFFCTAGVEVRGPLESRPADWCGLGAAYGSFSHQLQEAQEQQVNSATGVQDHELVLEATYRFYFEKNSLFFQPDLQYIVHPGGSGRIKDAVVLGCQLGFNF